MRSVGMLLVWLGCLGAIRALQETSLGRMVEAGSPRLNKTLRVPMSRFLETWVWHVAREQATA